MNAFKTLPVLSTSGDRGETVGELFSFPGVGGGGLVARTGGTFLSSRSYKREIQLTKVTTLYTQKYIVH